MKLDRITLLAAVFAVSLTTAQAQWGTCTNTRKASAPWSHAAGNYNPSSWQGIGGQTSASIYGSVYAANINRFPNPIRSHYARAQAETTVTMLKMTGSVGKIYVNARRRNGTYNCSGSNVTSFRPGLHKSNRFQVKIGSALLYDVTTDADSQAWGWPAIPFSSFSASYFFTLGLVPMEVRGSAGCTISVSAGSHGFASSAGSSNWAAVDGTGVIKPYVAVSCGVNALLAGAEIRGVANLNEFNGSFIVNAAASPTGSMDIALTPLQISLYIHAWFFPGSWTWNFLRVSPGSNVNKTLLLNQSV